MIGAAFSADLSKHNEIDVDRREEYIHALLGLARPAFSPLPPNVLVLFALCFRQAVPLLAEGRLVLSNLAVLLCNFTPQHDLGHPPAGPCQLPPELELHLRPPFVVDTSLKPAENCLKAGLRIAYLTFAGRPVHASAHIPFSRPEWPAFHQVEWR